MDFLEDVDQCLAVLNAGGLIVYPTDTIWGIGCDATNAAAVARIYALKQRAESKSMIVLVGEVKDVLKYTAGVDLRLFDYLKTVSKPTTVVYGGAIGLAPNLLAEDGSVGIRIVNEPFCRHLVKRFRKPLVSTSANISGRPAPGSFEEIAPEVLAGVDYVVKYRREDREKKVPSAVVRWGRDGKVEVLRP
ncbi:L-threonylcarbamoyladenylate synthase [Dinghuibacter silviterrae]|uniref:L-threonylcarbamoyladenylate synthase n=1 Tax=Dinghuibacter silviterrae TaxID=1539049 RepID=A0A4R8DRR7_9BACT|nr:L-threonylcarbamoyladenylate synthase [Dinghuibacter silviterrae]TDX00914.1 L-threonylcarbamoyladenylate synthase [Dinghuibacter silviterrae]